MREWIPSEYVLSYEDLSIFSIKIINIDKDDILAFKDFKGKYFIGFGRNRVL